MLVWVIPASANRRSHQRITSRPAELVTKITSSSVIGPA